MQNKWLAIFNKVRKAEGEEKASLVANTWLKKQVKKVQATAKTEGVQVKTLHFVIDNNSIMVQKAEDGQDYIDFVLSDNQPDREGFTVPLEILSKWEKDINSGLEIVGDIDHIEYKRLMDGYYSKEEVVAMLKTKPNGIAKAVRAMLKDGKLWVRAIIDKRYKKSIEKAKGVSLEALMVADEKGKVVDGTLAGFTFAVNKEPYNPRAVIA